MGLLTHFHLLIFWCIVFVLIILLLLAIGRNGIKIIIKNILVFCDYGLKIFIKPTLIIFYFVIVFILINILNIPIIEISICIFLIHVVLITPSTFFIKKFYTQIIKVGIGQIIIFPMISPLVLLLTYNYLFQNYYKFLWIFVLLINYIFIIRGLLVCLVDLKSIDGNNNSPQNYLTIIISWIFITVLNLYCLVLFASKIYPDSFIYYGVPTENKLNLLYFTIVAFTTTGFGDITAGSYIGIIITIFISIVGFLFTALFVGGILSIFTKNSNN